MPSGSTPVIETANLRGENGARPGNLSLWDLTQGQDGGTSFLKCFNSITDAAYAARAASGYPGKP